jgi:hypothetical protein
MKAAMSATSSSDRGAFEQGPGVPGGVENLFEDHSGTLGGATSDLPGV